MTASANWLRRTKLISTAATTTSSLEAKRPNATYPPSGPITAAAATIQPRGISKRHAERWAATAALASSSISTLAAFRRATMNSRVIAIATVARLATTSSGGENTARFVASSVMPRTITRPTVTATGSRPSAASSARPIRRQDGRPGANIALVRLTKNEAKVMPMNIARTIRSRPFGRHAQRHQ